jgi:hypothetical protein
MNQKQKHVRTIVDFKGKECIEKLTFYHSIIPDTKEKLQQVVTQEFPLVALRDITFQKKTCGSLDVIPPYPQPRPESFKGKLYTIKRDKQKSVATIVVKRKGRKMSLLSVFRDLSEFQTIHIIYDPALMLSL